MSRPRKATVDYFPHFCTHGKTLHILESKYGNDGYAFWFKLLELLGQTENHFIDCNDPTAWEYLLAKTMVDGERATVILNWCAALGAISEELWKLKVVRSENFVKNIEAVYRRREVDAFTSRDIEDYCKQKGYLNGVSVNGNPHRRVKESKVEENKNKKEGQEPLASAETKQEKLKEKIEKKVSALNATWNMNLQFYKTKYPGVDHALEKEKMECWIKENPGKALKRTNLNLFIHSWLGRVRPSFNAFTKTANPLPIDRPGPGETLAEYEARREKAHAEG